VSQATSQSETAPPDTVWVEEVSWFDRIPRSVAMLGLAVAFIGLWQLVSTVGIVSPIILPSPVRCLRFARSGGLVSAGALLP
jgi:NitT/TauT family transport system permease protein